MKNILVVDGANNCAYDVFAVSDDMFKLIFPEEGQDIEFGEDLGARMDLGIIDPRALADMYKNRVPRYQISGIHGIFFADLKHVKERVYPNKRDSDLDKHGR